MRELTFPIQVIQPDKLNDIGKVGDQRNIEKYLANISKAGFRIIYGNMRSEKQ